MALPWELPFRPLTTEIPFGFDHIPLARITIISPLWIQDPDQPRESPPPEKAPLESFTTFAPIPGGWRHLGVQPTCLQVP